MNVIFKGSCGAYALLGQSKSPARAMAPVLSTLLSSACASCQKRHKKTRRFTDREDDLIQEALDDEFGQSNMCARYFGCCPVSLGRDASTSSKLGKGYHNNDECSMQFMFHSCLCLFTPGAQFLPVPLPSCIQQRSVLCALLGDLTDVLLFLSPALALEKIFTCRYKESRKKVSIIDGRRAHPIIGSVSSA
jgi:hypothetical protein